MTCRAFRAASAVVLLAWTGTALAQDAAQSPVPKAPAGPAPVVVEPIGDHFVFAPEAKATEIDGDVAAIVGGYGGILLQESVLVGGAIYTLANGPSGAELTYGGMVVGFMLGDERRISYGARGLVGIGRGELTDQITFGRSAWPGTSGRGSAWNGVGPLVVRDVRYQETFMVFEPQADLTVRLGGRWRLAFGVGYRLTNASEYFDDRMHGVTGTVAIRFGGAH